MRSRDTFGRYLPEPPRFCSVGGCSGQVASRGWCAMHYTRWRRHGTPLIERRPGRPRKPRPRKIVPAIRGQIDPSGYRRYTIKGQQVWAHRMVMEYWLGRKLLPTEHVHHIDGDKLNNNPENLLVLDVVEHARLHAAAA